MCACQCPLLHHLVSLVLLTGCSRDLGEGHRKATAQFLGVHWLLNWQLPLLRLRGVRLLALHGERSTLYLKLLLSRVT